MIPDRDHYADKDGKITDDPEKYAFQVAVAGVFLPDHVAMRYGIGDMLVSVDEPNASRRVTGRSAASLRIERSEPETEPEPKAEKPEAEAAEPKAEKAVAEKPAKKAEAKKGAKKK